MLIENFIGNKGCKTAMPIKNFIGNGYNHIKTVVDFDKII